MARTNESLAEVATSSAKVGSLVAEITAASREVNPKKLIPMGDEEFQERISNDEDRGTETAICIDDFPLLEDDDDRRSAGPCRRGEAVKR